ncbi:Bestrophin, RFP-TM, chloride channel-domain-containing protein [Crassisporium funariophilum]|nr:Bestrophin, RFP-TM, chloride channel-domain-containing protein [Crassisporium funariophilum]
MSHHVPDPLRSPISRAESFSHHGFRVPDPFAPRQRPGASFVNALLATALFRCWHILLFFAAWSTLITILNEQGHSLFMQPTLLTVIGTVLGFIISYRTTSSFERYNEGRRLWSQIILASRTLARTIWFHVPDPAPTQGQSVEDVRAHALIEKKSAINLLEAFAVAIKHYLRGEDGIYYQDLYYLVKFLPAYAMPAGMPSVTDVSQLHNESMQSPDAPDSPTFATGPNGMTSPTSPGKQPSISFAPQTSFMHQRNPPMSPSILPPPVTIKSPGKRSSFMSVITSPLSSRSTPKEKERMILPKHDEAYLLPSHNPPKYGLFDIFPFSLLVKVLTKRGKEVKGKKAARMRAKLRNQAISHNLPLELSLYLSSYIASLQNRKICDVPTTNVLLASLNQLVDSLTGLERILTTPIPFSYSIHLWVVTVVYCLALPFQIYPTLKWLTIPATIISSFIFFGFLVAGEEIENPFGYDKNDLNLDHFTHNIIRNELRAVTSTPPPDPARWAFVPENNLLFSNQLDDRVSPEEWLSRGPFAMQKNLSQF